MGSLHCRKAGIPEAIGQLTNTKYQYIINE